jgi:hypothetical protein
VDLYPHGCFVIQSHCFFLDIPIGCMIPINILQELSRFHLPCSHSPSRPRLKNPLLCYTVPRVIHLSLPRFSRTGRTTHHVHDPNSLQELSWYPLPSSHSSSKPRLRHPLLCYTVPRVIHLALLRFSRIERIPKTLSSLIVEASLITFSIEASLQTCVTSTQHILGNHGLPQGSHGSTVAIFHAFTA